VPRRVNPEVAHQKARVAGLTRAAADPARITEARGQLRAAKLCQQARDAVAAWPPMTAEQKAAVVLILFGDPAA